MEKKVFWKVMYDGTGSYIDTADGVAEFLRVEMTEAGLFAGVYTVEPVEMTQEEVDALPEFDGF